MLYGGRKLKTNDFRKESSEKGVWITPTYPQSELTFILDDYGKKGSITFRFSGGDTPSAGPLS
jgi:hypothetical protein